MMVTFTINNRKIEVEEGVTILEAAKRVGIDIPTLCYHEALEPYGSCRLCVVEVTHKGRTRVVTACLYPVAEGIEVKTDSERILKIRRGILELLLARTPESWVIQELAKKVGVSKTRFKTNSQLKNSECILCGMCVRMCHEVMGIGAIDFINRGWQREVNVPFWIKSEVCMGCGACEKICPTGAIKATTLCDQPIRKIPDEYNMGLRPRAVAHILYPQAVPRKATIDAKNCVYLNTNKCKICEKFCDAKAIDFSQREEKRDINVGSIIIAPGFKPFNPIVYDVYGYKKFPNVVTSMEFERLLSASGPTNGHLLKPSDGKPPKRIAWLQCVGSRDINYCDNPYCSAVCCMYAIKEAVIAKEHTQNELDTTIFYMDIRSYGKGFEEYFVRARDEYGVKFERARVSQIEEDQKNHNLRVRYETDTGQLKHEEFDMIVLSVGLEPCHDALTLAKQLGIELNDYNFCKTDDFKPLSTSKNGIFVCGALQGPKDIPYSVMEASAAAAEVETLLFDVRGTLIKKKELPPEIDISSIPPRIGVWVCHCGINIAGVVDVKAVKEYAATLPYVVYVEDNLYTCSQDTQEKIKKMIGEKNLNRVVVASCTPRTHEVLFQETCREAGLNKYLFEMANIRDQCSWVHQNEPKLATEKAKELLRMAIAKAAKLAPLKEIELPINREALVVGGGVAGMESALSLAKQGFKVTIVEKESQLGGQARKLRYTFNNQVAPYLNNLIKQVNEHENIKVYLNSQIKAVSGFVGNFKSKVSTLHSEVTIEHGITIIAVGAKAYLPYGEYLYGEDKRVLTSQELDERLLQSTDFVKDLENVVFIQCVGSRQENRLYCSKVCCGHTIQTAIELKKINRKINIFVLFRDIRTYGLNENLYHKAREEGIIFVRYSENDKPKVRKKNKKLEVLVTEHILGLKLSIQTELICLATAIIPNDGVKELAQQFKVPLNEAGFFLEAHMKLRPVDFATDGVFIAGLAHYPKPLDEAIVQAKAAASRASTILSKSSITVGGAIAHIDESKCAGCGLCENICAYNAIEMNEKGKMEIKEALCKGCGACVATCRTGALELSGFSNEQILSMVEAL